MIAREIRITGIVQGVGFRPFVFTLAQMCGVTGWVLNDSRGVLVHAEGTPAQVNDFVTQLPDRAPAISKIETYVTREVEIEGFKSFEIRESAREEGVSTLISPDVATCPDCERELFDETDRRYHYPFINCTNCGPRFTIIDDIPYDRPSTSMRDFPMCEECAAEYADPSDRRFHAQPDACFVCGPRLHLDVVESEIERGAFPQTVLARKDRSLRNCGVTPSDSRPRTSADIIEIERERSDEIIVHAAALLEAGTIVAVKGLGGYHLACDATNEEAVAKLRKRKHRYGKPLAIMCDSLEMAREYCEINDTEADFLTGVQRPIVLLRRKGDPGHLLADSVAGDLPEMGVMLPYTPVQHLLMRAVGRPLVMTSGNTSGEPIETKDDLARERLTTIADAFLSNDREILSRYDDSVARVINGEVVMVRRARGYAPFPIHIPEDLSGQAHVLATGPEQKATFTLTKDGHAFMSQHIGDLENAPTMHSWEDTLALYERLFRIKPQILACDMHPEYLASKWARAYAREHDLPLYEVQHHHAHIAGVAAEHDISTTIAGIAFDGTGYGPDNTIWGGEILLANRETYTRFAHLDTFALPGGAAAVRRPARTAISLLHKHGLLDHPGAARLIERLRENELNTTLTMINKRLNSPLTSSMGRLFDAVASLTGIADDAAYEGSPAIELEAHIDATEQGAYRFAIPTQGDGSFVLQKVPSRQQLQDKEMGSFCNTKEPSPCVPAVIDHRAVLLGILDDVTAGVPAGRITAKFHRAVVNLIGEVATLATQVTGDPHVALAGGVFMNRFVLENALVLLRDRGLIPLTPKALPTNDGAVSYGQAIIALARHKSHSDCL